VRTINHHALPLKSLVVVIHNDTGICSFWSGTLAGVQPSGLPMRATRCLLVVFKNNPDVSPASHECS